MRMTNRAAVIGFATLAGIATPSNAAPSCTAACVRRMAECRANRCDSLSRKACRDVCRTVTGCRAGGARTRTLANVVTECRVAGGEWSLKQRLEIKRGDCPAVTVREFAGTGTVPDIGLCGLYGRYRFGPVSVTVAPIQRLGISPNGRTIVFELSTHNAIFPAPRFEVPEEGIFVIRSDGSGLRPLGPPSREKPFKGPVPTRLPPGFLSPGFNIITGSSAAFNFSPNGRFVLFADRGPGSDGTDAGQLVVMDVTTGERRQVTAFGVAAQVSPDGADVGGSFVDDDTIVGFVLHVHADGTAAWRDPFFVRRDGTGLRPFDVPVPIPGSHIVNDFQISGVGRAFTVALPLDGNEPVPGSIAEVFFRNGGQLLQLTRFGRTDTSTAVTVRGGHRIVFQASADPFGTNPSHTCQLFSIDRFGNGLKQVTGFDAGASVPGCGYNQPPPSCGVGNNFRTRLDPETGSILFESSCDPFALHPVSDQYFAVRPDGSGLRQLTSYRGMEVAPDGTITVELPGPAAYPGRTF